MVSNIFVYTVTVDGFTEPDINTLQVELDSRLDYINIDFNSLQGESGFFDPIYYILSDIIGVDAFISSSFTAYNFIFLPMVILFWLYLSLTKTASFVNFFNTNMRQLVNASRGKDLLGILLVKKFSNLSFKIRSQKFYSLLLLSL